MNHPICFHASDRVYVASAWYEHIPFAYYLIEMAQPKCLVELGTHNGVSYLAFCQAIQSLSLDTKAFAVDTWGGDEMAGYYGEEVLSELRAFHDSRYAKFSSLLRMTFDEGADYFSNGSIDLLHIDGLHTYEAVKHDFENWRKKLTPNAIVIFHDTNVHENEFGVWRYWEELREEFKSFEFYHGHGLGVLTLADSFPAGLSADNNAEVLKRFRNFFSVLGQKHLLENNLSMLRQEFKTQRSQVQKLNDAHIEANEMIIGLTEENNHLKQEQVSITNQKTDIENAFVASQKEITDCLSSTSWKVTRPFRWISKKLRGLS